MRIFTTLDEVAAAVGEELGTSEWLRSTRSGSTCSPTRPATTSGSTSTSSARRPGPFGGTIAHGYLTLSLMPLLGAQVFALETPGAKLNYGVNKVRFPNPSRSASGSARTARSRRHRAPGGQADDAALHDRDRGRGQAGLRRRDRRPAHRRSAELSRSSASACAESTGSASQPS